MADNLTDTNVGNIEYIRKQDAIDAFNRIKNTLKNPKTAHYDTLMFYEIEDVLEDVEPADVAPVVHAHWIRHDGADVVEGYYVPEYECSKCWAWKKDDSDYCPDCGARMDGEKRK